MTKEQLEIIIAFETILLVVWFLLAVVNKYLDKDKGPDLRTRADICGSQKHEISYTQDREFVNKLVALEHALKKGGWSLPIAYAKHNSEGIKKGDALYLHPENTVSNKPFMHSGAAPKPTAHRIWPGDNVRIRYGKVVYKFNGDELAKWFERDRDETGKTRIDEINTHGVAHYVGKEDYEILQKIKNDDMGVIRNLEADYKRLALASETIKDQKQAIDGMQKTITKLNNDLINKPALQELLNASAIKCQRDMLREQLTEQTQMRIAAEDLLALDKTSMAMSKNLKDGENKRLRKEVAAYREIYLLNNDTIKLMHKAFDASEKTIQVQMEEIEELKERIK